MGVKVEPGTDLAKQLAKFEQFPTNFTTDEDPPGNPYRFREYPKMLYKARTREDGKVVCLEPEPQPRGGGAEAASQYQYEMLKWDRERNACCLRVNSSAEEERARSEGWRESPGAALQHHEALQQDIAQAAAESAFAAQRMSTKAQEERTRREKASPGHVTG